MKKNKSQRKILLIFIILIISSILAYTGISYANISIDEIHFLDNDINPKYLEWQQLSDEEKANTVMPPFYTITLKDSVKRSTYNSLSLLSLKANTIDTRYDLREKLENIIVKNQYNTGDCWAFSTTSMIETTVAKKYNKTSKEYSPMHLEYYVSNTSKKTLGDGANTYLAMAYLASGKGPVYESELPFSSVYDETKYSSSNHYLAPQSKVQLTQTTKAQLEKATFFASIYKQYDSDKNPIYMDANQNEYTEIQVAGFRDLIKEHIKTYGAINACYYAPENQTTSNFFFNEATNSYYCNDTSLISNHQITIVGWDDNYSNSNFVSSNQPVNNGAWIVLNSWGKTWGENGYLYISYDDCHIEEMMSGIVDIIEVEEEGSVGYDNLYEYDPLGMSLPISSSNTSAYLANVFNREITSQSEYITKVGIFLYDTEGIEVYINPEGNDLNNLTKVASLTGSDALTSGYHTIDITPVQLTGTSFAVVIKYINSEGVNLPLECNLTDSISTMSSNFYDTATANEGESFISVDGTNWTDLNGWQLNRLIILKNTNACIKACTILQDPEPVIISVTGISLDKTQETLEIGETLTLTPTITPYDATNKNIVWLSSNTNVATVSESGIVTAIAEGQTNITVTTEDGEFTASAQITVNSPIKEEEVISVTGVTVDKTTATIKESATIKLTPTVSPDNATNKNVTWKSSNENIATVTGGVVTGIKPGTVQITVTTEDGKKAATCTIIVEEVPVVVPVTSVSLNINKVSIQVEDTYTFVATINPVNATNKVVTWLSSNENIVEISSTGIVTAKKEGIATITVITEDGLLTDSAEITVTKKVLNDDDIYKENAENGAMPGTLPKTGETLTIIILITMIVILGIICIIKFKQYNLK